MHAFGGGGGMNSLLTVGKRKCRQRRWGRPRRRENENHLISVSVNGPFDLFCRPQSARKHIVRAPLYAATTRVSAAAAVSWTERNDGRVWVNEKDNNNTLECGGPSWWNELHSEVDSFSIWYILPSMRRRQQQKCDDTYPNSTACVCAIVLCACGAVSTRNRMLWRARVS